MITYYVIYRSIKINYTTAIDTLVFILPFVSSFLVGLKRFR